MTNVKPYFPTSPPTYIYLWVNLLEVVKQATINEVTRRRDLFISSPGLRGIIIKWLQYDYKKWHGDGRPQPRALVLNLLALLQGVVWRSTTLLKIRIIGQLHKWNFIFI